MPTAITIEPSLSPETAEKLAKTARLLDTLLEDSRRPEALQELSGRLERLGAQLWEAAQLDAETVRQALEDARQEGEPLSLVILGETGQRLPWELLYHPDPGLGFLARHPWCVLSRRLKGNGKTVPRAHAYPLRILLFIASPADLDPERSRLDYEGEEARLFTALDPHLAKGEIILDVAEDGCLATLLERLESQPYHAVLLSLHGTLAPLANGEKEWGLLFEDKATGLQHPVAGSQLSDRLDRLPVRHRPGLVVLSACRSAQAGEEETAFVPSVAERLHRGGIEAVLGMRLNVLDPAASAFSTELFRRLALGENLGRSVTHARHEVGTGAWWHGGVTREAGTGTGLDKVGDPLGQWSLPVLFQRTADGPLLDTAQRQYLRPRAKAPRQMPGDRSLFLPERGQFIGRRSVIRRALRPFLDEETPRLLFTGTGGVGKTTLACLFARTLLERQPSTRLLGFRAPFVLPEIFETLRTEAFDGQEEASLLTNVQQELDERKRFAAVLNSLARRAERPCCFVLDNLESLQNLETLQLDPAQDDSAWFLRTVAQLPLPTRVLLTSRYPLAELENEVQPCPVGDAPLGDILRRLRDLDWPPELGIETKKQVFEVLGGNHRALEWTSQLLSGSAVQAGELVQALEKAENQVDQQKTEAALAVALEALRQNLLLDRLREQLTAEQDRLLQALCLYRQPVHQDGLLAVTSAAEGVEADRSRLRAYSLLEAAVDPVLELEYFVVPPVVRELIGELEFSAKERRKLHLAIARYHRFQGEHVSRRWSDDLEAIFHFRQAQEHEAADELAEHLANFYYRSSQFALANDLVREIVVRAAPEAPWWAWNRFGLCQGVLGFREAALDAYDHALPLATKPKNRGATLNNISTIHQARGDYDKALNFLNQSLKILRDIGDKAGEEVTLNNISTIHQARGDYDKALDFLNQSLKILRDTGEKAGEGVTLNNISTIHQARGAFHNALDFLNQSLKVLRESGDRNGLIATLHNMAYIALQSQDVQKAFEYWGEAWATAVQLGSAQGIYHVGRDFGHFLAMAGQKDEARQLLTLSLQTGTQAGFPDVHEVQALLRSLDAE